MRRTWLILIPVLAIVLAGTIMRQAGRRPAPVPTQAAPAAVPVEVATVARGDVARVVEVSGTVASDHMAEIFAKQSGRVARVLAQDGARVSAGQSLVQLDAADQQAELAQAQAAVAATEARLSLLENGLRPQERQVVFNTFTQAENQIKVAETQVAVAQASLRVAEDNLRRHEQLLRDDAVAQAQVDQARLQADQARAQLQAAQTQLETAKVARDSAAQQWNMTETGTRAEELRAARAQVAQARAVVTLVRQRVANMTIRAPFAGRVSGLVASPGDYVVSGDFAGRSGFIALVYDDRAMHVEVKVGERDIALIQIGQPASMRLEGGSVTPIQAAVLSISPAADPVSRASTVRLRLKDAPSATPGTFARGEIIVERHAGVLLAPRAAIADEGTPTVRVVGPQDTVEVRPVTPGLTQGNQVEIRSGVAAGDRVVVLGPEGLPAGTKVRVVNR